MIKAIVSLLAICVIWAICIILWRDLIALPVWTAGGLALIGFSILVITMVVALILVSFLLFLIAYMDV